AHIHRRAELGEAIRLESLDDLDVEMQLFRGGGNRQTGAFAAGTEAFADRARRGRDGRCGRIVHEAQGFLRARACAESGKSRRSAREYFSSDILSLAARATFTADSNTSGWGLKAVRYVSTTLRACGTLLRSRCRFAS